jgi:hypothetical protein
MQRKTAVYTLAASVILALGVPVAYNLAAHSRRDPVRRGGGTDHGWTGCRPAARPWRQWHHLGCLFEMCPYCGGHLTIVCHGEHRADIARQITPPDLAEYLSHPGTLAYLESLRAEPGMDPATMAMVIALARVFSPREADDALRETTPEEETNGHRRPPPRRAPVEGGTATPVTPSALLSQGDESGSPQAGSPSTGRIWSRLGKAQGSPQEVARCTLNRRGCSTMAKQQV